MFMIKKKKSYCFQGTYHKVQIVDFVIVLVVVFIFNISESFRGNGPECVWLPGDILCDLSNTSIQEAQLKQQGLGDKMAQLSDGPRVDRWDVYNSFMIENTMYYLPFIFLSIVN